MVCECGNILSENAAFCSRCGKKAEKQERALFCTSCGNKVRNDAVFCDSCGNRVNIKKEQAVNEVSEPIMSLDGLSLYQGKQPVGVLKVYSDKVEFVHSGRSAVADAYKNALFMGGILGGIAAGIVEAKNSSKNSQKPAVVDTFAMSEIAIALKSKHPKVSSYVEIVLKNGNKMKYLDRSGKYRAEQMFAAVDAINANL